MVTSGNVTNMAVTPFDIRDSRKLYATGKHHGIFDRLFSTVFLFLWPWAWPDDLHIQTWPVFPGDIPDVQIWTSYVKAFESYRMTDIRTDRQTHTTEISLYITPLRGWSTILGPIGA